MYAFKHNKGRRCVAIAVTASWIARVVDMIKKRRVFVSQRRRSFLWDDRETLRDIARVYIRFRRQVRKEKLKGDEPASQL